MNKRLRALALILTLTLTLVLPGCGKKAGNTVYVAEQFGTAYAPVQLMRTLGLFEDRLPKGTEVVWKQLGNTAAIREAMLAGEADLAFMAIPPFLIGADAGMQWEIFSGLSSVPMGLVARDPGLRTLADIGPGDRIALPQPGSVQHILLSMAARRELGSAGLFDAQLVTLAHPDAMSALLSGADVSLHFTAAPYLGTELQNGMSLILTGEDAMGGPFTFIVGVADSAFKRENSAQFLAFRQALEEAQAILREDPQRAAELLAPVYDMEASALLAELTAEGASYSAEVQGLTAFHDFMLEAGYIEKPLDLAALCPGGAS